MTHVFVFTFIREKKTMLQPLGKKTQVFIPMCTCKQCEVMHYQFWKCSNNDNFAFLQTTPTFETVDQNYVTSDAFDGSCGIELSVGTVYYMTGQIFHI